MMASFGVQEIVGPPDDDHDHDHDGTSHGASSSATPDSMDQAENGSVSEDESEGSESEEEGEDGFVNLVDQKSSSPFATSLRSKGFLWMAGKQSMFSWSAAGVYLQIGPEGRGRRMQLMSLGLTAMLIQVNGSPI